MSMHDATTGDNDDCTPGRDLGQAILHRERLSTRIELGHDHTSFIPTPRNQNGLSLQCFHHSAYIRPNSASLQFPAIPAGLHIMALLRGLLELWGIVGSAREHPATAS